jgi:hypothetical protein
MILSVVINGISAFAFAIALLYCLGDPELVASSTTGYPIFEVSNM